MAQVNGTKNPSMRDNTSTGKRKRPSATEAVDDKSQLGDHEAKLSERRVDIFQELLVDILEILKSYDTSPSILQHPIKFSGENGPAAKKAKLSPPAETTTVASLVELNAYSSMNQFTRDVDLAIAGVVQLLKDKSEDHRMVESVSSEARVQTEIMRTTSFKKRVDSIISREMVIRPEAFPAAEPELANGVQEDGDEEQHPIISKTSDSINPHRQVLTLFGSAPNARQLFSSFQQPTKPRDTIESKPLREWGLPNGISTTRIVPVHSQEVKGDKKVPTLGELFPQPASLVQLNPPRQSKHTATRSASVNWVNAAEASSTSRPYRRDSYATQALATGQWLKYNVPPSPSQLATPEAKRKQRDRALSFGEPQPTLPQETMDAHNQKKEEALFRSVYSSFAPSRDNTAAIISQRTKERLWWDRIGEKKYQELCSIANGVEDESDERGAGDLVEMENEHQEADPFKEAVETWEPENNPLLLDETRNTAVEPPETTQEVDEILHEISELLETLNSYQRVRNLSLSNNARTSTGPNATSSGTPTSPSTAEFDMYSILKSHLSIMVSSLPPWALARVNGERLGELNISTRLQVEGETFKGTVDEEELNARAKQTTTPAPSYPRAINPPASVPTRSSYTGAATQPYQRPGYAAQPVARPTTNPSSYLPNQQYSARPPSASQYLGASRPSYAPRPATVSTDRYNYTAGQHYNPQPPATPSGYANSNRSYANPNASYYGNQYTASQTSRPSQPAYQQRPVDAITYDYRASSGKASSPPQTNMAYSPPQRAYAGANATPSQPRPSLYQSNSSSYSQTASNAINGTGPSYAAYRSANEQAAFINRQRSQMDEKNTPIRQTSGTPQPPNGNISGQHSRTGTPQQNGIVAGQGQ